MIQFFWITIYHSIHHVNTCFENRLWDTDWWQQIRNFESTPKDLCGLWSKDVPAALLCDRALLPLSLPRHRDRYDAFNMFLFRRRAPNLQIITSNQFSLPTFPYNLLRQIRNNSKATLSYLAAFLYHLSLPFFAKPAGCRVPSTIDSNWPSLENWSSSALSMPDWYWWASRGSSL